MKQGNRVGGKIVSWHCGFLTWLNIQGGTGHWTVKFYNHIFLFV